MLIGAVDLSIIFSSFFFLFHPACEAGEKEKKKIEKGRYGSGSAPIGVNSRGKIGERRIRGSKRGVW